MHYALLFAVCLAIAALLLLRERDGHYVQAALLKGLSSLCFVILGFLCARHVGWPQTAELMVIGLCLGAAADVLLNLRQVFQAAGQNTLVAIISVLMSFGLRDVADQFTHFFIA